MNIMEHVIELPNDGFYKVVQIYAGGLPHLPFDYICFYHRDILEKFLKRKNIPFETKKLMGNDLPLAKGKIYEAVGMGELYISGNELEFSRDSFDYGLRINSKHIEGCKPFFKNKNLEIIIK